MQVELIRSIKKRRDDIHRRIGELHSQLEVLEARAKDVEEILKEALAAGGGANGSLIVSAPKIATAPKEKPTVSDLIVAALKELEDAGYEGAEWRPIYKIVMRSAPKTKDNTVRVMIKRLIGKRIEKVGNLYRLLPDEGS
jgi:hypothetical protein